MKTPNRTFLRLLKNYRRLKHEAAFLLQKGDISLYVKKLLEITQLQMQMKIVQ